MKRKLILLGTCLTLLCTSCGKSTNEPSSVPSKDTSSITSNIPEETNSPEPAATNVASQENGTTDGTSGEEDKKDEPLALGTKATVGTWKFAIKKAEIQNKILKGKYYQFKPSKGKKFICVTASVKNQGKKNATFLPRMGYSNKIISARLYYGDTEYTATNLLGYDKDILDKKIGASKVQRGIITFEVPNKVAKNIKKLSLKVGTDSNYVIYKLK